GSPANGDLPEKVTRSLSEYPSHAAFIDGRSNQGHISDHPDRFAGVQKEFLVLIGGPVLYGYQTLAQAYERCVLVFHGNLEDRSAHRNHSGRAGHFIMVRAVAVIDENLHASQHHVEKIAPISQVRTKFHASVWINFESTAVGNLESSPAVRSGDDDLPLF